MKQCLILFLILCGNSVFLNADPLLVAVLMVKNEALVMEITLQPLVDAGITDFLIYDTGSTDNTIQITQDFFISNNISNFVIAQGEFIDFATSRNRALELTEQHFPEATFMLMLDAEWILHNGSDLLKHCQNQQNSTQVLYLILVKGTDVEFCHPRLIRCRSNITFVGKVHETPNIISEIKLPDHIYFELSATHYKNERSKQRWLRDRDILLSQLEETPHDLRTIFFLAQTYVWLGDLKNAIKWYEYYLATSCEKEENFEFFYALAKAYEARGDTEKMIVNYLKAFNARPYRAEPFIKLAQHYYNIGSYHLCYLFARQACTIPYPHNDYGLIEKSLYDFWRYDLISATAHLMGDFKLGQQATLKALQAQPNLDYLHQNLHYYQSLLS
jgi:tetratricopeptide (TPR) repeat protein